MILIIIVVNGRVSRMCVGDGSVMDVRMQKFECEREIIPVFIFLETEVR